MGLVRRGGGGGGGGGDEGGGDEELGVSITRCEVCRRELLPWEDRCPDDGGRGIAPEQVRPEHDDLLARLLAEEEAEQQGGDHEAAAPADDEAAAPADDEAAAPADDEAAAPADDDEPRWPSGGGPDAG